MQSGPHAMMVRAFSFAVIQRQALWVSVLAIFFAAYYDSAMMDAHALPKGSDFSALPEAWGIFIGRTISQEI